LTTGHKWLYLRGVESSAPILEAEPISPKQKQAQASTAEAAAWLTHPTSEGQRRATLAERLAAEPPWQGAEDSSEGE
jgi:hypothetical protein